MKYITPLFISFCALVGCAQTITLSNHIKGKGYEGYVFPKVYASKWVHLEDLKERFTPTDSDIVKAETIVKEQIKRVNVSQINQGSDCPVIDKSLPLYKRQYLGYINKNGDRVIWVNFIGGKERKSTDRLSKDVLVILDGCSLYWNIKVNISKGQLYDLYVNGSS